MRGAVKKRIRRGMPRFAIDFTYVTSGVRKRYQRDACVQTASGARAEAEERQKLALMTGDPRFHHEREVELSPAGRVAPTLREFFTDTFTTVFLARYRPATRDRYKALTRQGIFDVLGDVPVEQIDIMADRRFDAWLRERKLQQRGPRGFLRTLLRAAVDANVILEMPALAPLPPQSRKLPDAPTRDEVEQMVKHAPAWLQLAIALGAFAGLRLGEVRALEVRDIDLESKRILVRRAISGEAAEVVTPKSGHERVVPIASALEAFLVGAIKGKERGARVVTQLDGTTPRRQAVLRHLTNLQAKHGLRRRSFHALRHAFCSLLIRGGASVEAVRVLAGHSKLDVTQRYVHADAGDLADAIAKLDRSDG